MREAVEAVRHEGLEIQQERIRGERRVALLRAEMREPSEGAEQAQRAQEDVAIERDQPLERRTVGKRAYRERCKAARPQPPQHPCTEREAARVRGGGRGADAGDPPAETIHIEQHGTDVHRIDEHLRDERESDALHAEQVAEHHVVRERERGAPDPCVAVPERRRADGLAAAERGQRERQQRHLQRKHRGAERERDDQRAQQVQADPGRVAGAMRLRDEAGRPHPQEAEAPEHEIEEQPAERDAAEILRAVEVAGDGRVDGAEDRLRQVREDDRERERENAPMRDGGRRAAGPVR